MFILRGIFFRVEVPFNNNNHNNNKKVSNDLLLVVLTAAVTQVDTSPSKDVAEIPVNEDTSSIQTSFVDEVIAPTEVLSHLL